MRTQANFSSIALLMPVFIDRRTHFRIHFKLCPTSDTHRNPPREIIWIRYPCSLNEYSCNEGPSGRKSLGSSQGSLKHPHLVCGQPQMSDEGTDEATKAEMKRFLMQRRQGRRFSRPKSLGCDVNRCHAHGCLLL